MQPALPYWRLSSFYLCYFALLGAIVPYWGLYLADLGFSAEQIGSLMAILMATRIVAPNLWGWLADRTGQRLKIIRFGSFATLMVFSTAFWAQSYWQMAALMFAFTFFWNAVLPQFEVITLQALAEQRDKYSRVRVWGSIGFIAAVVGLGVLFDYVPLAWLIPICWTAFVLIWLTTLWVPRQQPFLHQGVVPRFLHVLKRPEVLVFFIVSLLVQLGHGPYYTFYSIYMEGFGFSKTEIGLLWALGVFAEVLIFIVMHRLLARLGIRRLVLFSLMICAIRWTLVGLYPEVLPVMLLSQAMHAVTFGCLHAAGIAMVQHFFPASLQGQGQALYSSFGFGVGGALGAYGSGILWAAYGGSATFIAAAVVSFVAMLMAWKWLVLRPMA